jgi:hypothetical protein
LCDIKGLVKLETRAAKSIIVDWGATAADHHANPKQVKLKEERAVSLVLT